MAEDRPTGRPLDGDRPKIRITDRRGEVKGYHEPAPSDAAAGATDELQKLADDRLDQLMRLKADFENFRKREIREKADLVERASLRIVERLLPIIDDLERALISAQEHAADDPIVRGVELVRKQLHEVLAAEGLEFVEAGPFDPEHHEAVATVASDVAEPTVLEVVRPGYKLKGRTIRPALVHVSVPQGGGE